MLNITRLLGVVTYPIMLVNFFTVHDMTHDRETLLKRKA
jgi:Na+(H+)/acetate symporter ActP